MSQLLINTHMAQLVCALEPAFKTGDIATAQTALLAQVRAVRFIAECCRQQGMFKGLMAGQGMAFKAESERDVPDPLDRAVGYFLTMLSKVKDAPTRAYAFGATVYFMPLVEECLSLAGERSK